ncbi:NAD(P)H-dependent oxidoreductase [Streptosporangium sp. NPDC023615]|uniref:NADPH-dependent FMN reductase n=1 Tax=Streptosporangium sp. NPDC023615 TaxID=3154794 RepID=UPI0034357893
MSHDRLRLAIVIGSTREGRVAPTVARWFTGRAEEHGDMDVDVLDLAEAPPPARLTNEPPPEVTALTPRLAAADAYVIVTPEYNHSFPASLKSAIDWHFAEWQAKPIGFVSYGGMAGGLRAVEHLRQVFAELHAMTVRDTVSFHGVHEAFDADGRARRPEGCDAAAKAMLGQLAWWGRALREAKSRQPYTG